MDAKLSAAVEAARALPEDCTWPAPNAQKARPAEAHDASTPTEAITKKARRFPLAGLPFAMDQWSQLECSRRAISQLIV
jgi:hypothetical protein